MDQFFNFKRYEKVSKSQKEYIYLNYKKMFEEGKEVLTGDGIQNPDLAMTACDKLEKIISTQQMSDYMMVDCSAKIPKDIYIECQLILSKTYKMIGESLVSQKFELMKKNESNRDAGNEELKMTQKEDALFRRSISGLIEVLKIEQENIEGLNEISNVYNLLVFLNQSDYEKCERMLKEVMIFAPENPMLHYNIGHIYSKMNKPDESIAHFKLAIALNGKTKLFEMDELARKQLYLNSYNGLSAILRNMNQWSDCLFYLLKAKDIDPEDPDINNQLGLVYTELRRTDLAEKCYEVAIRNHKNTFISTDSKFMLAEVYLNMGHMHSYNGDNMSSIQSYINALKIIPGFTLAFQNKLMNMTYFFDRLEDKMYIAEEHFKINKIYKPVKTYNFNTRPKNAKIRVGFVSGDLIDHPVSYFIQSFLKNYDPNIFEITCYCERVMNVKLINKNLNSKVIKNIPTERACDIIYNDKNDILFDLSGHTCFNRMDMFATQMAPVQITYIGYPFTTGLNNMNYRITDRICDHPEISQKYYSEKLLFMPNSFLCYDPTGVHNKKLPELGVCPRAKNMKMLRIGTFNRVNKMTQTSLEIYNKILVKYENVELLFKTKALLNKAYAEKFLENFDKSVRSRIIINDCTIMHDEHLLEYNNLDLAIDTFPYAGTTTSCESLMMGVPVLSLYDNNEYYHAQNVTTSLLKNSGLDEFVSTSADEMLELVGRLLKKDQKYWLNLKSNTRSKFMNGKVCDTKEYTKNMTALLKSLV